MKNLIPHFIVDQYKNKIFSGKFKSAVMFLDISGFTEMTATLLKNSKFGAEVLSEILNRIFDSVISLIYKNNGYISGFAGDGCTAIFNNCTDSTVAAAQIIDKLKKIRHYKTKFGSFEIFVKIGLSYGDIQFAIEMVKPNRFTYYYKGESILNSSIAERLCLAEEIVADKNFIDLVKDLHYTVINTNKDFFKIQNISFFKKDKPKKIEQNLIIDEKILKLFLPEILHEFQSEGEFREVTAVFVAFKDNSRLNFNISLVLETSLKYGGYFSNVDFGDKGANLLIVFGAPISYENNTQRALDFLLSLENRKDIRAGLTSGTVFSGIVGTNFRCTYTCLGSTINLAARFMTSADWGEYYLDKNTFQNYFIKENYQINYFDKLDLKGFIQQIPVYKLDNKKAVLQKNFYDGIMIGREKELEQLQHFIKPLIKQKCAGLCYIHGEAGMGKTRLVYEFRKLFSKKIQLFWFLLRLDEISCDPFKQLAYQYFGEQQTQVEQDVFERKYESLISVTLDFEIRSELIRCKSFIASLLDINFPDSLYEKLEPKQRMNNIFAAIKNLIRAISLQNIVVLELEDLHLIDDNTTDFLKFFCKNLDDYPVAIIATSRYQDNGSPMKLPLTDFPILEISLDYLDKERIKDYVCNLLSSEISPQLNDFLYHKSEGNPFYIEQLILDLKDRNLLLIKNHEYILSNTDLDQIPANIQSILISRLDRLSFDVKKVVQAASVLGREFEIAVLSSVLKNKSGLNQNVKTAEKEKIWSALSDCKFIFKNTLLRESAYEMQMRESLKQLHQTAGEVIESLYHNTISAHYKELAYHYDKAENIEKAIIYINFALAQTQKNYQNQQTLYYYNRLLDIYENSPNFQAEYQITLSNKADILYVTGDYDKSIETTQQYLEIAQKKNDLSMIAKSHQSLALVYLHKADYDESLKHYELAKEIYKDFDNKLNYASVLGFSGNIYNRKAEFDKADSCFSSAITLLKTEVAENIESLSVYGMLLLDWGFLHWSRGNHNLALENFNNALTVYKRVGDTSKPADVYINLGNIYFDKNDFKKAEAFYLKGLKIKEEIGEIYSIGIVMNNLGGVCFYSHNYEKAFSYYQKSYNIRKELGDKKGIATSLSNLGSIYAAFQNYPQSIQCFKESLKIKETLGDRRGMMITAGEFAECLRITKNFSLAKKMINLAINISKELKMYFYYPDFMYHKALIYYTDNNHKAAHKVILEAKSTDIKQDNQLIKLDFLQLRIDFQTNPTVSLKKMEELVLKELEEDIQAEMTYNLWKLSSKSRWRKKALTLYNKLYKKTALPSWKAIIDELTSQA